MIRRRWGVAAALYAGALAFVVLSPIAGSLHDLTVRMYVFWLYDLRLPGNPSPEDMGTVLNVLLFVPVGFLLLGLTRWRWWTCTLACAATSAAIELTQLWILSGREATVGDVVANGTGGLLGALLAALLTRPARRPAPSA